MPLIRAEETLLVFGKAEHHLYIKPGGWTVSAEERQYSSSRFCPEGGGGGGGGGTKSAPTPVPV